MKAEIIIPSYNRVAILMETAGRVRQLYPELDICLGIQGESPSREQLAELGKDPHMRIEFLTVPSLTRTLNHCIRTSHADVVLMLDDDAVPFFGWAESHLDAFLKSPGLAFTAGREVRSRKGRSALSEGVRIVVEVLVGLFVGTDKKINGRIVGWTTRLGLIFGNFDQPGACRINTARGCNMAIRREPFMTVNGFNEAFSGNAWGNEADLGWRMTRNGHSGMYIGQAIVVHQEFASGGCREIARGQAIRDFMQNHSILIRHLGPQAWIGSLPRLAKKLLTLRSTGRGTRKCSTTL